MINARVHKIGGGKSNKILNVNLKTTYNNFLIAMAQKGGLKTDEDKLRFVYYLQLQDRIDEAIHIFSQVKPISDDSCLKVQYDYMNAYFDFFTGMETNYQKARAVVKKYEKYPHM